MAPAFPGGLDADQLAAVLRAIHSGQDAPTAPVPAPVASPSGIPSMLGGQMPVPQMVVPQDDAPAPMRVPSLLGAQPPVMAAADPQAPPAAPAPQSTGSLPVPAPQGGQDMAPAKPSNAPTPPARPSELSLLGAGMQPVSSFDPLTGQPVSGSPKPVAAPASVQGSQGPGGFDFSRALSRMNQSGLSDQLIAIGAGILSGRNFGEGLGQGLANAQKAATAAAAGNLQQQRLNAELAKQQRELAGQNQTAKIISQRMGIPLEDATALAMNPSYVQGFLTSQFGAQDGRVRNADGSMSVVPGSAQDPATIAAATGAAREPIAEAAARAGAVTKATSDATPADPYTLSAGQTRYDPETNQPVASVAPKEDATASQKEYAAAQKEGFVGSFLDFMDRKGNATRAQTTINNAINPILKGLGDQFTASAETARSAADQVRAIQNAREQLDGAGGIISGFRAGDRLALQKVGALLGVTDPNAIQNTESLRAALKPMVLAAVKGLGSNPSNGDRTFAEDFSGGNIALDEGSIRRILDLNERSARATIARHNVLAEQMLATQPELKQVGPMMQIQAPEARTVAAPQQAAPQQSGQQGSETPAMGPLDQARAAIAAGADPAKVKTRLLKNGIDPKEL
ncbi:hypothetical protein [Methylobacterium sp. OT2]|uniref:hypothetical protein n=1 Tax=Methylobacterium sp. OT2 TaxID=2813779 RepID=UPI00197C3E10|nr:hypothetical protein [Methylobacterium sp. OT2]MBN4095651.1 hypothetical protein [Methylobacterium sp. OT2]